MGYVGARGKLIHEKSLKSKISCQTPFKIYQYSRSKKTLTLRNISFRNTVQYFITCNTQLLLVHSPVYSICTLYSCEQWRKKLQMTTYVLHIMYMQLDCKYFNSSVNKMLIFPLLYAKDQINIKTPNPTCRLFWCLIEFIDWRVEMQSVMLVF